MKSGATDPFADDETEDSTEESHEAETSSSDTDETVTPGSNTDNTDGSASLSDSGDPATIGSNIDQFDRSDLPYTLRRESVKDERNSVHQLFVLDETDTKSRDAERKLEDEFGDVYRLDAREAVYLAGMQNLDDAATVLREWGYDL